MLKFLDRFKKIQVAPPKLVSWFEIPVYDFKRGLRFYSNVFYNIEFVVSEFNGVPHAIFKPSNSDSDFSMKGALVKYENKNSQGSGSILFFDANLGMEDMLASIETNGGMVLQDKSLIKNKLKDGKTEIPKTLIDGKVGYYAYFLDSEGNKMGLYSNA